MSRRALAVVCIGIGSWIPFVSGAIATVVLHRRSVFG